MSNVQHDSTQNTTPASATATAEAPAKVKAPRAARKPGVKRSALPKKIARINIPVADMTKAIAFYKDVLGFKFDYESAEYAQFKAGINVGLKSMTGSCSSSTQTTESSSCSSNAAPAFQARCTGIGFDVKNLDETHQTLIASGVTILQPPTQMCESMRRLVFQDPFGNGLSCYGK